MPQEGDICQFLIVLDLFWIKMIGLGHYLCVLSFQTLPEAFFPKI